MDDDTGATTYDENLTSNATRSAARRYAGKAPTATEEHKTRLYLDQSEALRHYKQAIRTGDQERADLQAEITSLRERIMELGRVIESEKTFSEVMARRAKYWFAKKKMDHPAWLKAAIRVRAQREER